MQAAVEIRQLDISSDSVFDISNALKRLGMEIDSVRRQLLAQTEFDSQASELRKISADIEDVRFHLFALAQAMNAILAMYSQTELSIENNFEDGQRLRINSKTQMRDFSDLNNKLNSLLYGR